MTSYRIIKLHPQDYNECSNILAMDKQPEMAETFYKELVNGNRITFIYMEDTDFIGEGSLVF